MVPAEAPPATTPAAASPSPSPAAPAAAPSAPAAAAALDAEAFVEAIRRAAAAAPPPPLAEPDPQVYDISLTYGELSPSSFFNLITLALPFLASPPPHAFHDFGSGAGFPPLLAATFFPAAFGAGGVSGVEISRALHAEAQHNLALARAQPAAAAALARVALHCGDGLEPALAPLVDGAALLFANSTCFGEALLAALFKRAERMAPGALLVCTSPEMRTPLFELCAWRCRARGGRRRRACTAGKSCPRGWRAWWGARRRAARRRRRRAARSRRRHFS